MFGRIPSGPAPMSLSDCLVQLTDLHFGYGERVILDGISLTVAAVDDAACAVEIAVIPHTLAVTTLGPKAPGDPVNIEADVLAKHVERLLQVKEH